VSHRITGCRSCGATDLLPVLDLGRTPLANRLLTSDQLGRPEPTYPLELVFCPACSLTQITETVPPAELFSEYLYFSSFSDAMVAHAKALSGRLIAERGLGPDSLVAEAASNDGYLLQHYRAAGVPVLGIEPAANVAREAVEKRGVRTVVEFFGPEVAARMAAEGLRADVFHAHNVLAHVADLNGFVRGIHTILKDEGVAVVEAPYVRPFVEHREFDTVYHEHLCYFSLTALDRLFRRHGLIIRAVEDVPIHGGTLRITAGRGDPAEPPPDSAAARLAQEREWGLDRHAYYRQFGAEVARLKETLVGLLRDLRAAGRRLAAYGASAKGSTLLNYFGIGRELLDFVADRSTVKQGRFTPGTRLPIVPPAELSARRPDYCLLLTWNFAEEILAQQADYRARGGRFVLPIPDVRLV
jgi:SAM-dependent methyltransferase